MMRVRVRHDIRFEYITSELPWSCIGRQQLGIVEAKIVDGGSPASRCLRSCERTWFPEGRRAEVGRTNLIMGTGG